MGMWSGIAWDVLFLTGIRSFESVDSNLADSLFDKTEEWGEGGIFSAFCREENDVAILADVVDKCWKEADT